MVQEFTSIVIYLYLLFSIYGVVLVYVYLRRNLNFSILTSLLLISCKKISVFSQPISYRSSNRRCSVRKGVLRNFAKFTEKHLCQSPFFNEVAGRACDFIKKGLWHRCFPVNFAKFLRTHLDDCFCLQKSHGSIPRVLSGFKD